MYSKMSSYGHPAWEHSRGRGAVLGVGHCLVRGNVVSEVLLWSRKVTKKKMYCEKNKTRRINRPHVFEKGVKKAWQRISTMAGRTYMKEVADVSQILLTFSCFNFRNVNQSSRTMACIMNFQIDSTENAAPLTLERLTSTLYRNHKNKEISSHRYVHSHKIWVMDGWGTIWLRH